MNHCFQFLHDIKIVPREIDCSQSPIFSWDRRDRARLTINAGHLDFQSYRVLPGEEYPIYLGGEGRFGRRRENYCSRLPPPKIIIPDEEIKMAAINGKTRSISTISRKNRGLWTVYKRNRKQWLCKVLGREQGALWSMWKWSIPLLTGKKVIGLV